MFDLDQPDSENISKRGIKVLFFQLDVKNNENAKCSDRGDLLLTNGIFKFFPL